MYLYFEICTFEIVSQNTLQKVNLMRPRIDIAGVIRPGGAIIADYFSVRALSCTTTTRPVQRKVAMSHEVLSMLLHKTLFGSGYCSVRRQNSVRDIHPVF